jgi:hypothetical protein
MFADNLKIIAPYNGPLAWKLESVDRAPRPVKFIKGVEAPVCWGVESDISACSDVVVVESNIEKIYDALHTPEWSRWLRRPGTYLLYERPNHPSLLHRLALWSLHDPWDGSSAPVAFRALRANLAAYLSTCADGGVCLARHILAHAAQWKEIYPLSSLAIKGDPVCIVGAGPSLDTDIERLRVVSKSAWVFSGGAAIPRLMEAGIEPDFLVLVDRLETQMSRAAHYDGLKCPALISPAALPQALNFIHGPRIHLSFEHPWLQWLEKESGLLATPLDLGWSLVTAAVAATRCASHTLLFGCDLALIEERAYAGNLFKDPNREPIMLPGKGPAPVKSYLHWQRERDFLAQFGSKTTFNVGSFGAHIPGWDDRCPELPPLDKSKPLGLGLHVGSLPTPPIELLVNWVYDKVKYTYLTFEQLMRGEDLSVRDAKELKNQLRDALEKEFSDVVTR